MKMRRKSLLYRLFLYFTIVIIIPFAVLSISTFFGASDKLQHQAEANMAQVINIASHHLEQYIRSYENSTLSLLSNLDIKEYLDLSSDLYYEQYYFSSRFKEYAFKPIMIRHPEVSALYVVSSTGVASGLSNINAMDFTTEHAKSFVQDMFTNIPDNGELVLFNKSILERQDGQTITLVRKIYGLNSTDYNGILAMEVKSSELSSLWKGIDLGSNGHFYITDKNNNLIYHSVDKRIGQMRENRAPFQLPIDHAVSYIQVEDEIERFTIARHSSYTGWDMMLSTPLNELKEPIFSIRNNMIWISCTTLAIAMLLAYQFSRTITMPIRNLRKGMKQAEKGDWNRIPLSSRQDEIDELIVSYNSMVQKLSELIEQVYEAESNKREAELERQRAELQALQLQINPHFLYNTLETIVCFPAVQDSDEISEIVKSMAAMLRYAVQTSLEEITVVNELKHVLNYMMILKHRYGKEFEIEVEISPAYLLKKMVRLTLQPLIENVFQHAFADGVREGHYIRINAEENEDYMVISVMDNGVGMSESALEYLNSRLNTKRLTEVKKDTGGIGILNVHRRIQLVFGDEYGLKIDSQLEKGTIIYMLMPRS